MQAHFGVPECALKLELQLPLQVVDEADRLLRQAYQEWLPQVLAAVAHRTDGGGGGCSGGSWRRRVVKVLASATLTRDPSKIDRLALHCPRYIAVSAEDHRSGHRPLPRTCRLYRSSTSCVCLLSEMSVSPVLTWAILWHTATT